MRKNKVARQERYKCSYVKCTSKGRIMGVYYKDGNYYCSKGCYKKSKEVK